MRSKYDCYEVREVRDSDIFASYENAGFISPIRVRFRNDCKFCFVTYFSDTLLTPYKKILKMLPRKLVVIGENIHEKPLYR